ALYLEALEINRRLDDKERVAWTLSSIGSTFSMAGDSEAAIPYVREGLGIARELEDPNQVAMHAGGLAFMLAFSGDIPASRPLIQEALAATRQAGTLYWQTTGEYLLGWTDTREGHFDDAHAHYVRSLDISIELGD